MLKKLEFQIGPHKCQKVREVQIEIPQILKKCGKIPIEIPQMSKSAGKFKLKIYKWQKGPFWPFWSSQWIKNTQKLFPHFFDQITSRVDVI